MIKTGLNPVKKALKGFQQKLCLALGHHSNLEEKRSEEHVELLGNPCWLLASPKSWGAAHSWCQAAMKLWTGRSLSEGSEGAACSICPAEEELAGTRGCIFRLSAALFSCAIFTCLNCGFQGQASWGWGVPAGLGGVCSPQTRCTALSSPCGRGGKGHLRFTAEP